MTLLVQQEFIGNKKPANSAGKSITSELPAKPPKASPEELAATKTREELLLATAPHINAESAAFQESLEKIGRIAEEEAAREALGILDGSRPVRHGVLLAEQPKTSFEFDANGSLRIIQESFLGDNEDVVIVASDYISEFIDALTDAVGIPSFGGR